VFNDWVGQTSDLNDPRRVARCFGSAGITSRHVAILAFALLIVAMLLLALLNAVAAVLGAAIAGFSLVYSGSSSWGKSRPIVASLLHLIGGAFHFLLGYGVAHGIDRPGIGIAIFFGLVFAGGHLNQEVRDYEPDLHNGIRTTAVVFGPRCAFFCSLLVFTAAYLLLIALVMVGTLPRLLLWTTILWPWLIACWAHALRNGLGFETATWIQRRYRLQFALLGLAMLLTAPPVIELARRPHQHVHDQIHHATAAGKAG
jgi:4-hydroxybenzoate polyprenyltransferase